MKENINKIELITVNKMNFRVFFGISLRRSVDSFNWVEYLYDNQIQVFVIAYNLVETVDQVQQLNILTHYLHLLLGRQFSFTFYSRYVYL